MRRSGSARRAITALALCLLAAPGGSGAAAAEPQRTAPAPASWEFTDLGGGAQRIEWPQRPPAALIVFFFDLKQADSLLGLNFMDALAGRAGDFGLRVVGVEATGKSPAEVATAMQGFTALYKAPAFPVAAGSAPSSAGPFERLLPPAALLVDARGDVVARRAAFDLAAAVELTRGVERLLGRAEGFFSPALRAVGVGEAAERDLGARGARAAARDETEARPLSWGDRLPAFDFTEAAGRAGRWSWPAGGVIRVALFWSGTAPGADEVLGFFDGLRRREGGEFLEVLAVEGTGLDAGAVRDALRDAVRGGTPLLVTAAADPQRALAGLFGAGDPLPRTFLIDGRGEVLYRADGFGADVRQVLQEKIARAGRLAGLGLPQAPNEVARPAAAGGSEAPSVAQRLDRDKELAFNLSRGDYFFINGQYERCLAHYQRYLELEPGSLHALVRLAQSHDLLGDRRKAREHWERVLAVSPGHEEGRARLEVLRRDAGR